MRYTAESKDRVRDQVDFIDLISAKTDLRRSATNEFTGLCPFHDERTPSFHVNAVEKVYYCFGCQAAGDVFTYVMETESTDFPGALETLAERYNVTLEVEQEDPQAAKRRQQRDRLRELLSRCASYYQRCLWEGQEGQDARDYLMRRGLKREMLERFGVGYSPSQWDRVTLQARRGGFSEDELRAAGMAQRSQDRPGMIYDRFRGRIMFPLRDSRGRMIGFGARALHEKQQPKYLNSPDGPIFKKGLNLYASDLARQAAVKQGSVILVEGYTDVVALHQAGIENVVGLMGTALTDQQVAELARLAPTVNLMLDADSAGQKAMLKAATLAAKRQLQLMAVPLPVGSDPADIATADGSEAIRQLLERAEPFAAFRVNGLLAGADLDTASGRDQVLKQLKDVFVSITSSSLKEELTRTVAERLSLSQGVLAELLQDRGGSGGGSRSVRANHQQNGGAMVESRRAVAMVEEVERSFLVLCIALPKQGAEHLKQLTVDSYFTDRLTRRAAEHLKRKVVTPLADLPADDAELTAFVAQLVVRAGHEPFDQDKLSVQRLQLETARLEREIIAETAAGGGRVAELASQREQVKQQLASALSRL